MLILSVRINELIREVGRGVLLKLREESFFKRMPPPSPRLFWRSCLLNHHLQYGIYNTFVAFVRFFKISTML